MDDIFSEVIGEFGFSTNTAWSIVNYGIFYEKIKYDYSNCKEFINFEYSRSLSNDNVKENFFKNLRCVFYNRDFSSAVQIYENTLVVNYMGEAYKYSKFLDTVIKCEKIYEDCFSPVDINLAMVRFIIMLRFSLDEFKMEDLFNLGIMNNIKFGENKNFNIKLNFDVGDSKDNLVFVFNNSNTGVNVLNEDEQLDVGESKSNVYLCDIKYFREVKEEDESINLEEWLDIANKNVNTFINRFLTSTGKKMLILNSKDGDMKNGKQ